MLLAPVPPSESAVIHLMAVTADGRRVFLSTQPANAAPSSAPKRPSCLSIVYNKSAVPAPAHQGHSRYMLVKVLPYPLCRLFSLPQVGRSPKFGTCLQVLSQSCIAFLLIMQNIFLCG